MPSELTILNALADPDFDRCLEVHKRWQLKWLDLKDSIYGQEIADLERPAVERVRAAIDRTGGLEVCCLSSLLLYDEVLKGEAHYLDTFMPSVARLAAAADVFKPRFVRLVAGLYADRQPGRNAVEDMVKSHPWIIDVYRRAIDIFAAGGHKVTIENESENCFLSTADEVQSFFTALDRKHEVGFTWDIQNQWSTGVFPSLAQYEQLRPLIQFVHVKGGRYDDPVSKQLAWNVALEEANWPVREIMSRVVADGVSPIICINMPAHGQKKPGYDYAAVAKRDVDFMRTIEGVV